MTRWRHCILWALLPWPATAALPQLAWPPGTQLQPLVMTWFGAPLDVQVAQIPLPVAAAMDALVSHAEQTWQATVAGGRVVLGPLDDAWRLTLTAAGDATVATLSQLDLTRARAPSLPAWLGSGWTLRAAIGPGAGQQWLFTHAQPPGFVRGPVAARLRASGWQEVEVLSPSVSHWRQGALHMRLVWVTAAAGTGLSVHLAPQGLP
ncbi:hypothetical protein IMZ29_21920 [Achromobacter sp. GG226]|uniref:hypothetical protein n=1 Tax=Verticiella alkaliphila TaxID=2779529 RepID=UPI001C0CF51B|nr:hypothetical protein [Verticiella sp. GG226]MBU4613101.1 hypothetical protein [Verticiella sp. GG226]